MRKVKKIVFCSLIAGLCIMVMCGIVILPNLDYTLPALAGLLLMSIAFEIGTKWAFLTYVVVTILSFIIIPSKDSVILFAFSFGYFPIIKIQIEKWKLPKFAKILIKYAAFIIPLVAIYLVTKYLIGLDQLFQEFDFLGKWLGLFLFALGTIFFIIYDIMITKLIPIYKYVIRPRFIKILK